MKLFTNCFLLAALIMLSFACKTRRKNVIKVDAEEVKISLPYQRLDQGLFRSAVSRDQLAQWHKKQLAENPFYPIYLQRIMNIRNDSGAVGMLYEFTHIPDFKMLQEDIDRAFGNTDSLHQALQEPFRKLSVLLPGKTMPAVNYYNSAFMVGMWPDSSMIGIGLEWYLGPGNRVVKMLPLENFPRYKRENMQPYYLVPDAVKYWLQTNFYKEEYGKNLLEYIVFCGKVMYAADAVLPETADSLKMNYTAEQMAWANKFEGEVWKQMVNQDLLFKTDEKTIAQMTSEGPFTPGFPQQGPPKLGIFIGWRMVADYMDRNPKTTLTDLLEKVAANDILRAYKPKKS